MKYEEAAAAGHAPPRAAPPREAHLRKARKALRGAARVVGGHATAAAGMAATLRVSAGARSRAQGGGAVFY